MKSSHSNELQFADTPVQVNSEFSQNGFDTPNPLEQSENNENADQPNWLRRHLFKLSAASFAGGVALDAAINPLGQLEHEIAHAAPVFLGSGAVTETAWISGLAIMAVTAGKKIGNPFTLRSRYKEITSNIVDSKAYRAGLNINTVGALGTAAAVAVGAVATLPPETWPGAIGIAAADVALTVGTRSGLYASIKKSKSALKEKAKTPNVTVREAKLKDIDRLADIDLLLFDKAYGATKPEKQEVVDSFTKRFNNTPGWMYSR